MRMQPRLGRDRLIARLDEEWRAMLDAVEVVPEAALMQPGAVGEWSVRDVMAHISTWEREFLRALPVILEGRRLPHYSTLYGGINAFNAMEQEKAGGLSPAQVRA